jgi:RNA polymerase sigma factor (sigma-70 family)
MDSLDVYMSEIGRHTLLDAEQECMLAKQYERGRKAKQQMEDLTSADIPLQQRLKAIVQQGENARQRLIRCNLRLVVSVVKRYRNQGLSFSDLVQEGNIGLMQAVDRYDYRQGTRFSTYAVWWIRQAVLRALANHSRLIRIPIPVSDKLHRLRRIQQELESQLHRRPTPQELAEQMQVSLKAIRRLLKWNRQPLSLDMPVGTEEGSRLGDFVPDERATPMDEMIEEHQLQEDIQGILVERLRPREQDILRMRFGLDGNDPRTLEQVARLMGVTRERIRQIERRALRRLRHIQTRHGLREVWI